MPKRKRPGKPKKTGPKEPSKFNEECIKKLEQAFSIGCNVTEACLYANITPGCFYINAPKGSELFINFLKLQDRPILKARQTVVNGLDDVDTAFRYLKAKRKDEFSERIESTGANGGAIEINLERKNEIKKALDNL